MAKTRSLTTFRSCPQSHEQHRWFLLHPLLLGSLIDWVGRADPALFAEIRQRIREGRWEVVGGWPSSRTATSPPRKSFIRHSLYGKQYCQRALGVDVKIGFNPDSFGHAAGLPTILKRSGYGYYVFMRPQEHEMKAPAPLLVGRPRRLARSGLPHLARL